MTLRLFASALAARDYFPLLRWMIFTGVTVFGFAIAWHYGLFQLMLAQDQTRISAFICILYAAISAHCLAAILVISGGQPRSICLGACPRRASCPAGRSSHAESAGISTGMEPSMVA